MPATVPQRHDDASNLRAMSDVLSELNRNYIRSVEFADVDWFRQNLADDFMNTNPDGSRGEGRYTDDWQYRDRAWRCVSPHVSRR